MKRFGFVLALLFVAISASAQSPCDYYAQKAQALGCAKDNYLLKFGHRYCRVFEKREHSFSAAARPVLDHIRGCLILAMEERHPTCQTAQKIGYETHYGCYVQNGFCELPEADKIHIYWLIRAEILNPNFRIVASDILRACRSRDLL